MKMQRKIYAKTIVLLLFMLISITAVNAQNFEQMKQQMKTAIIYVGKHGTTEKVARTIADKLSDTSRVELFSLKENPRPDIRQFDRVILGSSIYMGSVSKKMKAFCKENEAILLQKKLGLFICGMHPSKEEQEKETKAAYPEALQKNAAAIAFLGGEFLFESMNFFERFVAKKIAKTTSSVHRIDWDGVDNFAKQLR